MRAAPEQHLSSQSMPDDFVDFWRSSLESAVRQGWAPRLGGRDHGTASVEVKEIVFSGDGGNPIRGWLKRRRGITDRLPAIVRFTGYGAGSGAPTDDLTWAEAGFAELVMDTRGQGDGGTADGSFAGPGFLTRGIAAPESYYYRRVFVDAASAVAAIRRLSGVDPARVATLGNSQGGGIAVAAAALDGGVGLVLAQAPFLADIPWALRVGAQGPWRELERLSREDARAEEWIAETLPYFDVVNHARLLSAPLGLSCGLDDDIVPPETTFAVHQAAGSRSRIHAWPGAGHEAGGEKDVRNALALLSGLLRASTPALSKG